MEQEGMNFPLHLGVTEAGDGEDGRIKSAVGIGTLLLEGIGDTIRVSLSEDPEAEIPVAKAMLEYIAEKAPHPLPPLQMERGQGGEAPLVLADYSQAQTFTANPDMTPDFLYLGTNTTLERPASQKVIVDFSAYISQENCYPLFTLAEQSAWFACDSSLQFIRLDCSDLSDHLIELLKQKPETVIILSSENNDTFELKSFIRKLIIENITNSIIIHFHYNEEDLDIFRIKAATDAGSFFLDRLADGIFLSCHSSPVTCHPNSFTECSFGILQATGRRISKTEYIACPSCGRTLFDLQTTLKKIKAATGHLKGLKIGVMGCIVNGPGEMADADYGYVGAGPGCVSLYRGKECIKKNIPEAEAVEELLRLIKDDAR